ncbi:MAG: hypothetical protein R3E97_12620 [Candidatus Eisenbacteria bacterium]
MRSRYPLILLVAEGDEDEQTRWTRVAKAQEDSLHVHFVSSGEEILQYLRREGRFAGPVAAPHLLLMSWAGSTPGTKEALRAMKLDPRLKFLPTIVLVENGAAVDMAEAYLLGAASCCAAPKTDEAASEFLAAVRSFWGEFVRFPIVL